MLKKILIFLETLLLIAAIGFGVYTFMEKEKVISDRDALLQQNTILQQSVDAIGPTTTVYTVKSTMLPGDEAKIDDFDTLTVPVSSTAHNTVTSLVTILGTPENPLPEAEKHFYKVRIEPGTMLTTDLFMYDTLGEPVYEFDLTLSYLPIGIKAGDYIDIRVTYPFGETFPAIERKRVYAVYGKNTVKIKVTEGDLAIIDSLITEYAFYSAKGIGFRYYASKYVEPGMSEPGSVINMYPVTAGSEVMVTRNPNIADKTKYVNTSLRTYLDEKMALLLPEGEEYFGTHAAMSAESAQRSGIDKATEEYIKILEEKLANGEQVTDYTLHQSNDLSGTGGVDELTGGINSTGAGMSRSGSIADLNQSTGTTAGQILDDFNELQEMSETGTAADLPAPSEQAPVPETMGNVDSQGNKSNVSTQEKLEAGQGDDIFAGAELLE